MAQQFSQSQIVCPIDGAADTVQKVSAITHGAALGGRGGFAAPLQLIQMLMHNAARPRPRLTTLQTIGVATGALASAFCACTSVSMMSSSELGPNAGYFGFLLGGASVTVFILLMLLIRERLELLTLRQSSAMTELEREHLIWEQLYYCHRHDALFMPGLQLTAPPQAMRSFLQQMREAMDETILNEAFAPQAASVLEARHMDGESFA